MSGGLTIAAAGGGLTVVGAVVAVTGAALAVVGVLGLRRRLPRNRVAGVRTPATLRDDETFAVGNQVSAPLIIAAGMVAVVSAAAALVAPSAGIGWLLVALGTVATLVFTLLGGLLGNRAAALVPRDTVGGCTGVCTGCSLVEGCPGGRPPTNDAASS